MRAKAALSCKRSFDERSGADQGQAGSGEFQVGRPVAARGSAHRRRAHGPRRRARATRRTSCCRACSRPSATRRPTAAIFREMGELGLLGADACPSRIRRRRS
ncbi:MAG: hypothetical protein MZV49_13955 [Rhodopseudomonas palustris]|nr:hypothetical protein [Rhodopseudomonas palustris]